MVSRIGLAIVIAAQFSSTVAAQQLDEYQVEAAFLYNFGKFIDWPPEAFSGAGDPFTICVLGHDPFGGALDDVVAGRTIAGRPVAVRRIADAHRTAGCHILFVGASEQKRTLSIIAATEQPGILTVSEAGSPTADGVIISFTLELGKVRFEINLPEARREKLHFSSKLLSLATQVRK